MEGAAIPSSGGVAELNETAADGEEDVALPMERVMSHGTIRHRAASMHFATRIQPEGSLAKLWQTPQDLKCFREYVQVPRTRRAPRVLECGEFVSHLPPDPTNIASTGKWFNGEQQSLLAGASLVGTGTVTHCT